MNGHHIMESWLILSHLFVFTDPIFWEIFLTFNSINSWGIPLQIEFWRDTTTVLQEEVVSTYFGKPLNTMETFQLTSAFIP